jgi:hypothetical protein
MFNRLNMACNKVCKTLKFTAPTSGVPTARSTICERLTLVVGILDVVFSYLHLTTSKASELSNVDSGLNDDAEDGLGERFSSMATVTPRPSTGSASGRTPYHILAVKVSKMQEQLENITSVP